MDVRGVHCRIASLVVAAGCACPSVCFAQTTLSLQQAIDRALQNRPALKAEAERIAAARGLREQARAFANPELLFQNENLRPGQTYSRDVDTLTYLVQPLEPPGKRAARIAVADGGIASAEADYLGARLETARRVSLAYWAARGAQEASDLLHANAETFQHIVDYHNAQLSVGAIAEQDVLRVRLEGERLHIVVELAALAAGRARLALLREIGDNGSRDVMLTDALDAPGAGPAVSPVEDVIAAHPAVKAARAALTEAQAKARVEDVAVRPTLAVLAGYKRTLLPDHLDGVNTAIAGVSVGVPLFNRNQGNRAAAAAEVRRAADLLEAAEADVRADYEGARQEYELRSVEVTALLSPLRDHATQIAGIAQAAYTQAGTDLLRLLDAQRAELDAEAAWAQGMVEYRQSIANLEAAEGVGR